MFEGYAELSGIEIWNNPRTLAYLSNGLKNPLTTISADCSCDEACTLFCAPGPYVNPAYDDAPWYDVRVPESAEFAGLFVTKIEGFDAPTQRNVSDNAILGGSLGPLRFRTRCITVTGQLRGKTCCATSYGLAWLTEALSTPGACDGCALGEMRMLKCCPPLVGCDDIPLDSTDFVRTLIRTGLTDGPKVLDRFGSCCTPCGGTTLEVQFTLCSESPYIFGEIDWCLLDETFDQNTPYCLKLHAPGECDECSQSEVKTVERQVPRPQCPVTLKSDLTWCPVDPDSFPALPVSLPPDCTITVASAEPFEPDEPDPCLVSINADGSWEAIRWDPTAGDFPPCSCTIEVAEWVGDPIECCVYPIKLRWPGFGNPIFWEAVGWTPGAEIPPCDCCVKIVEICGPTEEPPEGETCTETDVGQVFLVGLNAGGIASSLGWDPAVDGFPPPGSTIKVQQCDPDQTCCDDEDPFGECCDDQGEVKSESATDSCEIDLTVTGAGGGTWSPVNWNPAVDGFPPKYCNPVIVNQCGDDGGCVDPTPPECTVRVFPDGTWEPVNFTYTEGEAFPPAGCADFTVADQVTTPITEVVIVSADTYVPDCGPRFLPPPDPTVPTDDCYCEPWVTFRACCTLDNRKLWNDATTVIEVFAGSKDLKNAKIEAYLNPFNEDEAECPCYPEDDPLWKCRTPCAVIQIPQLPSGTRLIIDSRYRVAEVVFPGNVRVPGQRFFTGPEGVPFEWFDVPDCARLCVIAAVDCFTAAPDATISVGMAERYLASGA